VSNRYAKFALLFALIFSTSLLSAADTRGERYRRNLKRWQSLSKKQRLELRQKFEKWRSMSVEERKRIRENHKRFQSLSRKERENLRKKSRNFKKMKPQERKRLRDMSPHWKVLKKKLIEQQPKKDREKIKKLSRSELNKHFRALLQQHREQMTARFMQSLPADQAERLKALPERKRQREFKKLFNRQLNRRDQQFLKTLPKGERARIGKLKGWARKREINRKRFEAFIREQAEFMKSLTPEQHRFLMRLPKDARLKWLLYLQARQKKQQSWLNRNQGKPRSAKNESWKKKVGDLLPPLLPPKERVTWETFLRKLTLDDWEEFGKLPRHKRIWFLLRKAKEYNVKLAPLPKPGQSKKNTRPRVQPKKKPGLLNRPRQPQRKSNDSKR